jgi:hypothetical protein
MIVYRVSGQFYFYRCRSPIRRVDVSTGDRIYRLDTRIFFNDQLLTAFWFTLTRRNRKNNLLIIDERLLNLLLTHDTQNE